MIQKYKDNTKILKIKIKIIRDKHVFKRFFITQKP